MRCMRFVCSTAKSRTAVPEPSVTRKRRTVATPRGTSLRSSSSVSPFALAASPRTGADSAAAPCPATAP